MNKINPEVAHFLSELDKQSQNGVGSFPSRTSVEKFVDGMFDLLFNMSSSKAKGAEGAATKNYAVLMSQLTMHLGSLDLEPARIVNEFSTRLPAMRDMLLEDARAALAFDPAATSLLEVIASYPGFYAISVYRLAHILSLIGAPLLPRMFTEYAHRQTGIDIHPTAKIGRSFVIDHGTGVVIGATAQIGSHVTLYHGVTLGALQVNKSLANIKRHPTIEDHVTIYANATVLGGETIIGHHSVIGGSVWVTRSVQPNSTLYFDGQGTISKSTTSKSTSHQLGQTKQHNVTWNPMSAFRGLYQWFATCWMNQGKRPLRLDKSMLSSES